MIQVQLKIRIKQKQEDVFNEWLLILTRVWNWAIRKIEQDAKDNIYYSKFKFHNLLANHSQKLGIPSHCVTNMLAEAHNTWQKCFKKKCARPRFKGKRNPLTSIPFPDPIKRPDGNFIQLPIIGKLRFHKQSIPEGKIKCARLVKRASGWYLCLFVDAKPNHIEKHGNEEVGIDPGFKTNITLSNGEKIQKPKRLEEIAARLKQAQKGGNKRLVGRLYERMRNRRKDDNHKLSRKLIQRYQLIVFSKDNIKGIASKFGKSVGEATHYQLRSMLAYKAEHSNRKYIEVDSKGSTCTCFVCKQKTGPTGFKALKIREWECSNCHSCHDRDVNSALNTLELGKKAA